jgi:hypothetical protein
MGAALAIITRDVVPTRIEVMDKAGSRNRPLRRIVIG